MTGVYRVALLAATLACAVVAATLLWLAPRPGTPSPAADARRTSAASLGRIGGAEHPAPAEQAPAEATTAAQILVRARELWEQDDFDGLADYGVELQKARPRHMPTLVLKGFLDLVCRGEIRDAYSTLLAVSKALEAQDDPAVLQFRAELGVHLSLLQAEIHAHEERGTSEDMLRRNASPRKYKEAVRSQVPPLLRLVEHCPEQEIPATGAAR